jgi:PAS domain S-box-containing protein
MSSTSRRRAHTVFRKVNPYLGALSVLALLAALLGAIYFTWFDLEWTVFLAGVLFASVLAMVASSTRAEWRIARRNLQIAALRKKLNQESMGRERAEKAHSVSSEAARYIDEEMPVMVAYIDSERHVLYHNRSLREWLRKPANRINQKHLRDVTGRSDYAEIEDQVTEALSGRIVRFERNRRMPDGSLFRLATHYVPQYDEDGKVPGFFAVLFDITSRLDLAPLGPPVENPERSEQAVYADSMAHQLTNWENIAGRLKSAFKNDEFRLYCQAIVPLSKDATALPMYEILVRLQEEEENLLPPGAFLPIVEGHGLLTDLDRLVVRHLLEWVSRDQVRQSGLYSVNISGVTLSDPDFPAFVLEALREHRVPAKVLCLEFTESEAVARDVGVGNLVERIREAGGCAALSQFGRGDVSFALLKALKVDYVKIDGNIVLNMLRDRVALAKVKAITQVTRAMGTLTIAELVENEETAACLREIGVNRAQGFGISVPQPLDSAMSDLQLFHPRPELTKQQTFQPRNFPGHATAR